ncbi:MAG TPA: molybdopterin-dependent oxidoreductase, partial [Actinomycetota bacterium]
RDVPDAGLARRALENVRYKVVVDIDATAMAPYADAMLPAAPYLEKDGHYTNWEGRSGRLRPVRGPQGLARSEWEIFQELSEVLGTDMGFHSIDALHEEMARLYTAEAVDGRVPPRSVHEAPRGASAAYAPPPEQADGQPPSENGLILFTYPLLVDEGRLLEGADALKEALEEPTFVELHSGDALRLGVEDGAAVRLRTQAGQAEALARVTDAIAQGAVFVPWNQPGLAANTLLSGRLSTAVTVESVASEAVAG